MRTLSTPHLVWLLLSACLSTEDVSLGELPTEVDADAGADAAALLDAQAEDADSAEPHELDASSRADGGAHAESDAAQPLDAARDSASDANDGNVPLICVLEPWHCR